VANPLAFRVEQRSSAEPTAVYDAFLDVERWPEWMPTVSAASWERWGAPDIGEGGIRLVGMRGWNVRDEIIGGTRPHHYTYATSLPGFWPVKDYRGDIRIDVRLDGPVITWTATFTSPVPGLGRPLQFFFRSLIERLAAALAQRAER